jgi:hypothetical protein
MFVPMINDRAKYSAAATLAASIVLAVSGCKAPQAFGDRNSVIVRADPALWSQVDSMVMATLEERAYTTRPERIFKVTFVAADDTLWQDLRKWQQVVVVGTRGNSTIDNIVSPNIAAPALAHTTDVWARGQTVTAVLLPESNQAAAVRELLPDLYTALREQYDEWLVARMYTTGVNDSLDRALQEDGLTLQLPKVYMHSRQDSILRFGNPYRQGDSDLLRSMLLTWVSGTEPVTPEALAAWREMIGTSYYEPAQDVLEEGIRFDSVEVDGVQALELRGVWQDRADFPAAGPFITRAIACPSQDRTYYIDAWLFAPGKDKYSYLRQMEILLDTFRCAD